MNTECTIDYTAARERLTALSTDLELVAGFDRAAASGELDDGFLAAVDKHDLTLDWIFRGKGKSHCAA